MFQSTFSKNQLKKVIARWKKQKVRLIVVAGRRKSGKDVFVDYVMRHYPGFKHYRIAEAPVLIEKILGLPSDRKITQALFGVNKLLYPILGESAYKRRVARLLDREKPKLAIIEAARTKEEFEEFVRARKGILIGVVADDRFRYERAVKDARSAVRGEKRDEKDMSFGEFMKREKLDVERDIDWIVKRSHFVLSNTGRIKQPFFKKVDAIMSLMGFTRRR
ncbi:MAG: hypothetical protein HYW90_05070 [Candidatus Sungbacteria bacterium]|nr:hypothetical protein [Candidatus Sungbacteria bacterium]